MSAIRKDLHDLRDKIERLERDLSEVHLVLDRLTGSTSSATGIGTNSIQDWGTTATAATAKSDQWVNKAQWGEWFDRWFQQAGIIAQPIGAEKLQAMMLGEGVRPQENLLSSGIITIREE